MQLPDLADDELSQASVEKDASGPTEAKPLDACVICLQPVSERAVAVPCNHCAFDFICIVTWAQTSSACPLCKTELSAVQYDWRSPDDYKEYRVVHEAESRSSSISSTPAGRTSFGTRRPRPDRYQPYHRARHVNLDLALSRRRYIYRHKLYSSHVGSNRISSFRDFTPQTFNQSTELQSRARKWIRRELQVFDFLATPGPSQTTDSAREQPGPRPRTNNAEFLLEYIVSILKTADVKGSSGNAQTLLQEFLGEDNAPLFLHELNAWLRSPYTELEDWDSHVQYRVKLPGSNSLTHHHILAPLDTASQSKFTRRRGQAERLRRRYEVD